MRWSFNVVSEKTFTLFPFRVCHRQVASLSKVEDQPMQGSISWVIVGEWSMVLGHLALRCLTADGAMLLQESGGSELEEQAKERPKSEEGDLGFVSSPWQLSRCLIKLSPCLPPCSSFSASLSLWLSFASLSFTLVSAKQPKKHSSKRGYKAMVTSCRFLTTYGTRCLRAGHLHALHPRGSPWNI